MKRTMLMRDPRMVARVINLAHQFDCSYTELFARKTARRYVARIELQGTHDALRRLDQKITALLANEDIE